MTFTNLGSWLLVAGSVTDVLGLLRFQKRSTVPLGCVGVSPVHVPLMMVLCAASSAGVWHFSRLSLAETDAAEARTGA